jgi:Caspase domain
VRVINLGMRATQQVVLTVKMPGADATAMLRVGRDDRFVPVAFQGAAATTTLAAGDYVITLDSAVRPGPDAPFTVSTDVEVLFMSAGTPVNDVRPIIVGPGRQVINSDPKDPWPPPPPPLSSASEQQFLSAMPITATIKVLLDAFTGKGSDDVAGPPPAIHALLIGIDGYAEGPGAGGAIYRPLRGCVRDILEVEAFLRHNAGVPASRITRLIAPAAGGPGSELAATPQSRPTYGNIVAAWKRVMEAAKPNDVVYIHYSGHGGRSTTLFPAQKPDGLDESIAPCDINDRATGRYLRDVEIAVLLKQMAQRGLLTTVVLDSCHSGSATRGNDAQARHGDSEDRLPRAAESAGNSAVASRAELEAMAAHLARSPRGDDETWRIDQGGLTSPTTVIAACRPNESAYEYPIDGMPPKGVLTHFWLDTLRQRGAAMTYRTAYRQVFAQVQALFTEQTPLLLGASNRLVLGTSTLAQPPSIAILEVHGEQVKLAAGTSGLLEVGTRLAVIPGEFLPELASLPEMTQIEVTAVTGTTSQARVVRGTGNGQPAITLGSQAVIVTYAPTLRREVRWAPPKPGSPPLSPAELTARHELDKEIATDPMSVIGLATTESAHYQVAIDGGKFVILDPAGAPLPYLRPELGAQTPDAPRIVKARLVHLARFHNVQLLTNTDRNSPLAGKLELTLHATTGGNAVGSALPNHPRLPINTAFHLRIRNRSTRLLSLAVLNLAPDWSIAHMNKGAPLTLESGQQADLPLTTYLPPGYEVGTDIVKVIGTLDEAYFEWLTLPALDQPYVPNGVRGRERSGFEELLSLMHDPLGTKKNLTIAMSPTFSWSEAQLSLEVYR